MNLTTSVGRCVLGNKSFEKFVLKKWHSFQEGGSSTHGDAKQLIIQLISYHQLSSHCPFTINWILRLKQANKHKSNNTSFDNCYSSAING